MIQGLNRAAPAVNQFPMLLCLKSKLLLEVSDDSCILLCLPCQRLCLKEVLIRRILNLFLEILDDSSIPLFLLTIRSRLRLKPLNLSLEILDGTSVLNFLLLQLQFKFLLLLSRRRLKLCLETLDDTSISLCLVLFLPISALT